MSRQVVDFKSSFDPLLQEFIVASRTLGEPLITLSSKVKDAFDRMCELIQYGLENPAPQQGSPALEPLTNAIVSIVEFKTKENLGSFTNHVSTVRESIVALGWINVKPAPTQYVRDMKEAGEYYGNRVLSAFKGKQEHVNWIAKWTALLQNLQNYVKQHFLTGFTWGTGSGGACGAPPPPPPPPIGSLCLGDSTADSDTDRRALLNDLNQGADIMRRLKPAGQSSRSSVPSPGAAHKGPTPGAKPTPVARPPKIALEGRKWLVEYVANNYDIRVNNDDMSQSLSMFKCQNSGVVVANKMNSVVIDSCKKSTVVLQDIISSVELIRCDLVKVQCAGRVPLISLDSCESVQVFASHQSRDLEIISSKSSSCNLCLLEPDGDYKELPIPEQIKTVIHGNKLESIAIEKN